MEPALLRRLSQHYYNCSCQINSREAAMRQVTELVRSRSSARALLIASVVLVAPEVLAVADRMTRLAAVRDRFGVSGPNTQPLSPLAAAL
jgi:hypothetical protein